ncbi:hypothetical protein [Nocardia xishanensis]|uniref:hypothetical protein n=1 Tax=Nocardia xishanensis TaxID=238964 RepID=UPI000833D0AD|nr:hypothetical protein [Nocardia xishanensis]
MWFGYAQAELLPERRARVAVRQAMVEYATYFGFGSGELFVEPTAPEQVLRAMLAETDRRDPAASTMPRLEQLAVSWDIDLGRVFAADSPRTQVLWHVMETIEGAGGGHLIVPSREHLTRLGPSGNAVIQRLTRMPQAHIYFLDTAASTDRQSAGEELPVPADTSRRGEQILVESRVGAIPAVTRLDMVAELTRRRESSRVDAVDALYVALIDDANAAAAAVGQLGFGSGGNDGMIRLILRDDGRLVVELEEMRHRNDDPSPKLTALAEHTERFTERDRTITRCTLAALDTPTVNPRPVECLGSRS